MAAVGSVMRDKLSAEGYGLDRGAAVLAASAAIGETIPPNIAMLVLGSITSLSIASLFAAGFLPAAVIALCLVRLIYVQVLLAHTRRTPRARLAELTRAAAGAVLGFAS